MMRANMTRLSLSGEQITAGLLAITLQDIGIPARSWSGWQVAIKTDGVHGAARIAEIDAQELRKRMEQGQVAVIAGFQGIGPDKRVTTLGRGGSDTSAVAVAAALEARCDIYTDVDGVYTTDPRDRFQGAQAQSDSLRGNARAGLARCQGVADAIG